MNTCLRAPSCARLVAVLATLAACGDSASGNDSSQGGAGGGGGQGGQQPTQAEDATSAEECVSDVGEGGAELKWCDVFTVVLSEPVAAEGLTASVTTSLGVVPLDNPSESPTITFISDPVERVTIEAWSPGTSEGHYAPDWVEVELRRDDTVIGSGRFDRLAYSCRAASRDDWCWEAAPVTLTVTP